jgi:hypothetical protein
MTTASVKSRSRLSYLPKKSLLRKVLSSGSRQPVRCVARDPCEGGVDGFLNFMLIQEWGKMQPGRGDTPLTMSERLVARTVLARLNKLCFSTGKPSRTVTVTVAPDTSGIPGGTSSMAIRTGMRCANRTQV